MRRREAGSALALQLRHTSIKHTQRTSNSAVTYDNAEIYFDWFVTSQDVMNHVTGNACKTARKVASPLGISVSRCQRDHQRSCRWKFFCQTLRFRKIFFDRILVEIWTRSRDLVFFDNMKYAEQYCFIITRQGAALECRRHQQRASFQHSNQQNIPKKHSCGRRLGSWNAL